MIGGGGTAILPGRPQTLDIIQGGRTGRLVVNGANRKVSEVVGLIGQNDPRRACRLGTKSSGALAIRSSDRKRAKTDRHKISKDRLESLPCTFFYQGKQHWGRI